jgi:asparagine synthase (glutamine-hydrolysing)
VTTTTITESMSAIFGIYFLDGRPMQESGLQAMANRLGHRAPDGVALWQQGSVGAGHCLFATTPESLTERLPLIGRHGKMVLTADARIDNRKELLSILRPDEPGDQVGDAHLILAAYERWGEEAPKYLIGDFAFAVWDVSRRTVFCARDPMGIKPLYYHHSDKVFAFASEIKAVLVCPDVPSRLNEAKVADHLLPNLDDTQSTFYQDVFRLPAAHSITVTAHSIQMRRYWSLDCTRELRLKSDHEYAEAFREIFIEAVRCRLRSVGRVGSTLSGGLDSSSIACTASLQLSENLRPLRTFTAIFPGLPERELRKIDERPYVAAVLKSARFDQSFVRADQVSPLQDWRRTFGHFDEACLAPNLYLHWELYKAASAKGVRVLLDGLDGDTTVSHGLGFLTELARAGRWRRLFTEARAFSRRSSYPVRDVVRRFGIRPLVPERVVRRWRALRPQSTPAREPARVISETFARRIPKRDVRHNGCSGFVSARQDHSHALSSALIPYAMEFADAASGACAIEVRYPFFDRRLVEFCLALPVEQKLHDGWTRAVMRRAMSGILPTEVQWRMDKADLSCNFRRGLFEQDRPTIEHVIMSRPEFLEEYVDLPALQDAYKRWSAQPVECYNDALTLFRVATLALWLENSGPVGRPGAGCHF